MSEVELNIDRYDCGNGGQSFCAGCYQMEYSQYGDYVRFEDYEKLHRKLEAADAKVSRLKEDNHNGLISYVELVNKREMRVSGLQNRVREALDRASCPAAFMDIAIDTIGLHGCGEIADTHKKLEEGITLRDNALAEVDRLNQIIREAMEQKPVFVWHKAAREDESEVFDVDCACECCVPLYTSPVPAMPIQDDLEEYNAGHLNDFGGGNVSWWQDYIRSELGRAYDFYQAQIQSEVKPS